MAPMQKKRPVKKVLRPQQGKKGVPPPVSPVRKAAIAAGVLVVVIVAVIAAGKFAGRSRVASTAAGPGASVPAPAGNAAETVTGSGAVLTGAVIVPPKPSSSTPLSIAYGSSNSGAAPLTVSFRWYVDGSSVQDGPSNMLQPGPYRKGASVYAEVSIADQSASGSALNTPAVVIGNGPPEVTAVALGPENPVVGVMLSATPLGKDPDDDPLSYTYQWRVNGNPVGATGSESTFSTAGLKKRDSVSVLVNCTDGEANGSPVASNTVTMQNQAPKFTSSAPLDLTAGRYVYQVTAKDPDDDPLSYRLVRFPSGMTIDASSGLVSWDLPKGTVYPGRNEVSVAVTVSDGDGGSDSQEFTLVLSDVVIQ